MAASQIAPVSLVRFSAVESCEKCVRSFQRKDRWVSVLNIAERILWNDTEVRERAGHRLLTRGATSGGAQPRSVELAVFTELRPWLTLLPNVQLRWPYRHQKWRARHWSGIRGSAISSVICLQRYRNAIWGW